MFHFILRRVLQMLLILFLVSSAVFFMFKLVPGDVRRCGSASSRRLRRWPPCARNSVWTAR